jgi:ribosomal protein L22
MVGHTFAVHDGRRHVPVFVVGVDGRPQARRVRPDADIQVPRRTREVRKALMTGPNTNERPGTRAVLRNFHMSATKARVVLNLIRGEDVATARDILTGTTREAADVIGKLLDSAIANAVNNDGLSADELYVSAAYADEGVTMKRFSPRARGRAGRINKRSTRVTVVVSRMDRGPSRNSAHRPQRSGRRVTRAPRERVPSPQCRSGQGRRRYRDDRGSSPRSRPPLRRPKRRRLRRPETEAVAEVTEDRGRNAKRECVG